MASRESPKSLRRYWIGALVLIVIGLIIYSLTGGPSPPDPGSLPPAEQTGPTR